jgi:hypothetical protein
VGQKIRAIFCKPTPAKSRVVEDIAMLGAFLNAYAECQNKVQEAHNAKKLEYIFRLTQQYGECPGIVGEIFPFFADVVNKHFGIEDSGEGIETMWQAIANMLSSKFQDSGVKLNTFGVAAKKRDRNLCLDLNDDDDSKRKEMEVVTAMLRDTEINASIRRHVRKSLKHIYDDIGSPNVHPILNFESHFIPFFVIDMLDRSIMAKKLNWMAFLGTFKSLRKNVKHLSWTQLGFRIDLLTKDGALDQESSSTTISTNEVFDQLGTVAMPKFQNRLVELHGMLQECKGQQDYIRTKAVGILTALLIFVGQVLAGLLKLIVEDSGFVSRLESTLGVNITAPARFVANTV